MLVDSHCHLNMLNLEDHGGSLACVIENARQNDVAYFLCVSVDLETLPIVIDIAERYPFVFASVGVHPNEKLDPPLSLETLLDWGKHEKVIAIGETGLDYYRSTADRDCQQTQFRTHIQAAKILKKPLIIHMREANEDTLRILKEENASDVGGVMHCFTESWDVAKQAIDLGFYISLSGIVTFKNATQIQTVAKNIPLKYLLVETDAPYLAPVPHRGKPNEPAYVKYVAEYIATLRQMPYEEIAEITTENFFRLFIPQKLPCGKNISA